MQSDIRIHIAHAILESDTGLSALEVREYLVSHGIGEYSADTICSKLSHMTTNGNLRRVEVASIHRRYIYRIGSIPVWGQYSMFRMDGTRYKILSLGSKGLGRYEIADILSREGITPREIYDSIERMRNHGWIKCDGPTIALTRKGEFVLAENRILAAHNLRGNVREFHSLSLGQNEGISTGGIPS